MCRMLAPGGLRLGVPAAFPHGGDVAEPEVHGLHVHGHLGHVVQDVRIVGLVLRAEVVDARTVGRLGRAEERGRVVRDEASLPAVAKILARRADEVLLAG